MRVLNKFTIVLGLRGSGKSNFIQYLVDEHEVLENHLVYDLAQEHEGLNRYVPKYRKGDRAKAEVEEVLSRFVVDNRRELRPDVVVLEELNRYAPNKGSTPEALLDVCDLARHYGVGVIGSARRPAQMDTDILELADNLVVFRLSGKNDKKALDAEVHYLGELVRELPQYHFAHVDTHREVTVFRPVPERDTTGEL